MFHFISTLFPSRKLSFAIVYNPRTDDWSPVFRKGRKAWKQFSTTTYPTFYDAHCLIVSCYPYLNKGV